MGRHARRVAVFTDDAGRRTRLATNLLRGATVTLLGGITAVAVSMMARVPLPGIVPPVRLPTNERPAQVQERQVDPGNGVPGLSALNTSPPPLGAVSAGPTATPTSTSLPAPTTAAAPSSTSTPDPSSTPATTPTSGATATPTARGRPTKTPPGHTRHP